MVSLSELNWDTQYSNSFLFPLVTPKPSLINLLNKIGQISFCPIYIFPTSNFSTLYVASQIYIREDQGWENAISYRFDIE